MKVRDGSDVPGATSQRIRLESVEVVSDVGNNHFHDFIWEAGGRSVRGARLLRRVAEQAIDVGLGSTPNYPHGSQEVYFYGANGAEVRAIYVHW